MAAPPSKTVKAAFAAGSSAADLKAALTAVVGEDIAVGVTPSANLKLVRLQFASTPLALAQRHELSLARKEAYLSFARNTFTPLPPLTPSPTPISCCRAFSI
jgi:hypothetical protein